MGDFKEIFYLFNKIGFEAGQHFDWEDFKVRFEYDGFNAEVTYKTLQRYGAHRADWWADVRKMVYIAIERGTKTDKISKKSRKAAKEEMLDLFGAYKVQTTGQPKDNTTITLGRIMAIAPVVAAQACFKLFEVRNIKVSTRTCHPAMQFTGFPSLVPKDILFDPLLTRWKVWDELFKKTIGAKEDDTKFITAQRESGLLSDKERIEFLVELGILAPDESIPADFPDDPFDPENDQNPPGRDKEGESEVLPEGAKKLLKDETAELTSMTREVSKFRSFAMAAQVKLNKMTRAGRASGGLPELYKGFLGKKEIVDSVEGRLNSAVFEVKRVVNFLEVSLVDWEDKFEASIKHTVQQRRENVTFVHKKYGKILEKIIDNFAGVYNEYVSQCKTMLAGYQDFDEVVEREEEEDRERLEEAQRNKEEEEAERERERIAAKAREDEDKRQEAEREEKRKADEKKKEADRIAAAEKEKAEKAAKKKEEARLAAEAEKAEDERKAAEAEKAEADRKAAEKKAEEKKAKEKKAEEKRKADEKMKADKKAAEERRQEAGATGGSQIETVAEVHSQEGEQETPEDSEEEVRKEPTTSRSEKQKTTTKGAIPRRPSTGGKPSALQSRLTGAIKAGTSRLSTPGTAMDTSPSLLGSRKRSGDEVPPHSPQKMSVRPIETEVTAKSWFEALPPSVKTALKDKIEVGGKVYIPEKGKGFVTKKPEQGNYYMMDSKLFMGHDWFDKWTQY